MDERWQQLRDKINALTLRERVIALVVVIAVEILLIDMFWLGDAMEERSNLAKRLDSRLDNIEQLQGQIAALRAESDIASAQLLQQQELLRRRLTELDEKIESAAEGFIPSDIMPRVLEEILAQQKGLSLVSLANIPPMVQTENTVQDENAVQSANANANANKDAQLPLYKHGVELRVKGDYHAIVSYLEKLESMRWYLHWHALDYRIDQYPVGELGLQVYTFSMDKEWLGV